MKQANTVKVLKSLADETRLSMVRRLAEMDCEVVGNEIVTDCSHALNLSQPTMSHHFNKLVAADVLIERKVGVEKMYQLNKELLENIGIDPNKL